jgi:lipopolysaccharide/colanic/teichoic acid biosynthesis glycosyltransferase
VTLLRMDKVTKSANVPLGCPSIGAHELRNEETFKRIISVERKRAERSGELFLLMLLETSNQQCVAKNEKNLTNILSVLALSMRATDVIGWYKDRATVGVMFTGLARKDKSCIMSAILSKVGTTFRDQLTPDQFNQLGISFHFYPDDWDHDDSGRPSDPALYPDLSKPNTGAGSALRVKRAMDIVGSALMLMFFTPLLLLIALAIRVSSKGPVLFRQQRVGQYGRCFTFLKFRSMHTGNDHNVHKEYVTKLIAGEAGHNPSRHGNGVYKLTNDMRVTRLGRFLRRTSLDELPQLVNVLKGDMSLVGPRPAIQYELAAYQTWHRRRVLEVKPGITGLWQVSGRGSVKFDEMVRMDLRYATSWSPWFDLVILLRTPRAVIGGAGAY